jgi:hypothetical protein
MAPKWDDTFKRLFAASSQDFVQWLMPGATLLEKAPLELKTTTKTRNADVLYKISIDGQEALLHIEFQKRADSMMARRVWEYNVLATLEYGCPVYSVVIYLRPTGEIAQPFLIWGLPQFETVHTCRFTTNGIEGATPALSVSEGRRTTRSSRNSVRQSERSEGVAHTCAHPGLDDISTRRRPVMVRKAGIYA